MKEVKLLLEKSLRAIKSSELLLNENDYETSISRSYYAMFYAAEALLLTKNLKFSSHKSVISLFGQHYVKTGILKLEHGKNFSKAFEKRIISDYDFMITITKDQAQQSLLWAKEFTDDIKRYLLSIGFIL